ncbi:metalloprotease [Lyophyllum atratum]|nr:metalloprotease [Lyophyllum atratum]
MLASLALTLLGAAAALASPFNVTRRVCGTVPSDADVLRMEIDFQAKKVPVGNVSGKSTLNVYWHVINIGSSPSAGNIPDSQIEEQIAVLNDDYANTGATWSLAGTTRTVNTDWFNKVGPGSSQERAMKNALRQGGPADLNVYSVGFKSGAGAGLLGYATFPSDYSSAPKNDGVVILFSTVPGGTSSPYDLGRTLTHEAGHWVGLFHTFQGGCKGGDSVSDTPPEASPAFGCPRGRDSCLADAGLDPIENYMDYSDDACMTNFTPGQIVRLKSQLSTYRGVSF